MEQLGVEEVDGEGQEGKVEVEREKRVTRRCAMDGMEMLMIRLRT